MLMSLILTFAGRLTRLGGCGRVSRRRTNAQRIAFQGPPFDSRQMNFHFFGRIRVLRMAPAATVLVRSELVRSGT